MIHCRSSSPSVVGNDADPLLWIAAVVNEDPYKEATGLTLPNANRQIWIELRKPAGLQNIRQNIGGDFGVHRFSRRIPSGAR